MDTPSNNLRAIRSADIDPADARSAVQGAHDSTDGEADITRVSAIGRELRKNGCLLNVAVPE